MDLSIGGIDDGGISRDRQARRTDFLPDPTAVRTTRA